MSDDGDDKEQMIGIRMGNEDIIFDHQACSMESLISVSPSLQLTTVWSDHSAMSFNQGDYDVPRTSANVSTAISMESVVSNTYSLEIIPDISDREHWRIGCGDSTDRIGSNIMDVDDQHEVFHNDFGYTADEDNCDNSEYDLCYYPSDDNDVLSDITDDEHALSYTSNVLRSLPSTATGNSHHHIQIPDRRTKSGFKLPAQPRRRPMSVRPASPTVHVTPTLNIVDRAVSTLEYDSDKTVEPDERSDSDDEDLYVPSSPRGWQVASDESDLDNARSPVHWSPQLEPTLAAASDDDIEEDMWTHPEPLVQEVYQHFKKKGQPGIGKDLARLTQLLYTVPPMGPVHNHVNSNQADTLDEELDTPSAVRRSARLQEAKADKVKKCPRNIPRSRPAENKDLASSVRAFAFQLMGRTRIPLGPIPIESVTFSRVTAFLLNKRHDLGPSEHDFKIFLDLDSLTAKEDRKLANTWNATAAAVFVKCFVADYPEYNRSEETRDKVKKAFTTHIKALKEQFTKYNLNVSRSDPAKILADLKAARLQLRRSRCKRRLETFESYRHHPQLCIIGRKLKRCLTYQCCSGDETDKGGNGPSGELAITNLPWRAACIREFMRVIDLLYILLRFPKIGKPTPGNLPHPRFDPAMCDPPQPLSNDPFDTTPVPGLPINFYADEFLESLTSEEREFLDIQPFLDLTLPQEILDVAETAAVVKDRKTAPLPRNYDI
ncbi:hypothetical protein CVT24_010149 [Panaeolus cyanescens]|uniref:Uncharacterized protein n=1 Tax=Panaeolus cyanescens TaxID=181874 RepID=A0A409WM89_9AGAR|nr:hypothetical protein CVT24_010149 [Panaeolus cyanescens]